MSKSTYLIKALSEIKNLVPGEEFIVKDLFKGYEWKRIPKASRLTLGSEFFRYITSSSNQFPIVSTEKTKSNKQKYKILNVQFSVNSFDYDDDYDDEE